MAEHTSGMGSILTIALVGVGAYLVYEWYVSSQQATAAAGSTLPPATPGTTTTMNQSGTPTSVSTAPPTTPPAAAPISNTMQTLAANMTSMLGQATGSADQWDYEFQKVMGAPIDQKYGLNFDAVYGAMVNGARNNGALITAMMFLQLAATANGGSLPGLSGFGAISVLARGPALPTRNNMIFSNHHPLPYSATYTGFRGLGSYTQASGFERALLGGQPLIRYFA